MATYYEISPSDALFPLFSGVYLFKGWYLWMWSGDLTPILREQLLFGLGVCNCRIQHTHLLLKLYLSNQIILLTGVIPSLWLVLSIASCVCCIPQLPHKICKYYFLRHSKFLREAKHYGMNSINSRYGLHYITI